MGFEPGVLWESPCSIEPDSIGILHVEPKIFRSKLFISKVSNPKAWSFMFQR
jgi:hypothetical protein